MKINMPVTGVERRFSPNIRIVSTTDVKGVITYVNKDFIETSGFSEEELIGKSHNVVRHPDMPPAAFADLWETLKQGKPWMGVVKNRCKNGDFYWVDAYVTPLTENGELVGYQSVRIQPSRAVVERAEALYARIRADKLGSALKPSSLVARLARLVVLPVVLGFSLLGLLGELSATAAALACLALVAAQVGLVVYLGRGWAPVAAQAKQQFTNPIAQYVYTGLNDECGAVQMGLLATQAHLTTALVRIDDSAGRLTDAASSGANVIEGTQRAMSEQQSQVEQVASAVEEMSATVHEIAQSASNTASATQEARLQAGRAKEVVGLAAQGIGALSRDVETAADVIQRLRGVTDEIGSVVHVIRDIADQTNLLALNAAIEAARAGEQGRGFAVVADEVRTLASRTQKSTEEIGKMIERLLGASGNAVDVMKQGSSQATLSVAEVGRVGDALTEITQSVEKIADMTAQIATAAEEQSTVAEEINRNVAGISAASHTTVAAARESAKVTEDVADLADRLRGLARQFGSSGQR